MAQNPSVSLAQEFTGLPMEALIGGPLSAAVEANSAMAVTQTKFILETCFAPKTSDPDPPGSGSDPNGALEPVMIQMELTRGVLIPAPQQTPEDPDPQPSIQSLTTTFNLPLIAILPINTLGVDTVDISFEMEVSSSFSEEKSEESVKAISESKDWSVKAGWGPIGTKIKGKASYDTKDTTSFNTHYEQSNSAKYTVHVHAKQLPNPDGLNTVINVFADAIQPIEMPAPTPSPE